MARTAQKSREVTAGVVWWMKRKERFNKTEAAAKNCRCSAEPLERMMKKIISRKELREKLLQWQQGKIAAPELNYWAGKYYPNDEVEYEDWDEAESNSVTNEVLAALDMMDMNLMTPEDVPAYLDFLETSPASFQEGYKKLQQYLEQVDIKKRATALVSDPFYERFCR